VLVGKDPSFVSAPGKNDLERVAEMVKLAYQGEPQQFEFWGRRSTNEYFLKDVRLQSGVYFGQRVIVAIAHDITARKKAENAMKNKVEELEWINKQVAGEEQELARLKHEVNDLLEKLDRPAKYSIS
jgi:beta-lactamase class D